MINKLNENGEQVEKLVDGKPDEKVNTTLIQREIENFERG